MLDDEFGVAFVPEEIETIEEENPPRSLQKLTSETGEALLKYAGAADDGLLIPQVNHDVLPILWVVGEDGEVYFALEEVISLSEKSFLYPLSRKFDLPSNHAKLGHPSLLQGDRGGRIGGEIRFDPDYGEQNWVISNKSGRYGYPTTRQRKHLENVAKKFEGVGIRLEVYYIPPSGR